MSKPPPPAVIPPGLVGNDSLKFSPTGKAFHFPGITCICHLPASGIHSRLHASILSSCLDRPNPTLSTSFVRLPASSLHMTLYDTRTYPQSGPAWTPDPEKEAARARDLGEFREVFRELEPKIGELLPIRMEIDSGEGREGARNGKPLQVPVRPADEVEEGKLGRLRGWLREGFGMGELATDGDDGYKFHVTTHYPLKVLGKEEFEGFRRDWREAVGEVKKGVEGGRFDIDKIELCTFEDMLRFEVVEVVKRDGHGGKGED